MEETKTVTEIIEKAGEDICMHYCKWPDKAAAEGRDEDWLTTDPESPCETCPLRPLY